MKNKVAFWITTIFSLILVGYVLTITVVLPVYTRNSLPKAVVHTIPEKEKEKGKKSDSAKEGENASAADVKGSSSDYLELRKREILMESRFELASDDSMYLVLDLNKNMATLEIKGVMLHEAHIVQSHISNAIRMYSTEALLNWISEPFVAKRIEATIPKISFIEKIAPKDTLEANKRATEPKIPKLGDVYIIMDLDRNLRLIIDQQEKPDEEGEKQIGEVKRRYAQQEVSRSLKALTSFDRDPIKPQIEIVLPKSDATILYKALPLVPHIILQL